MKILIYGDDGPINLSPELRDALKMLGCEVDLFDWTKFLFRAKKANLINRILDRLFVKSVSNEINEQLKDFVNTKQYDLMIVITGWHLFGETILSLKNNIRYTVLWSLDEFFCPSFKSYTYTDSFDKYDCIFTNRDDLMREYADRGAKHLEFLDFFYYLGNHPVNVPFEEQNKWGSDIAFFGSWSKDREEILDSLDGFDLKIWGGQWHKASNRFRQKFNIAYRVAWSEEMSLAVNSSKLTVDHISKHQKDKISMKNYQIPASGGLLIEERTDKILKLFEEDKEIVCYSSPQELRSKCVYYLAHEPERKKIAHNAYLKVIGGNHSIIDRAKQIIKIVDIDKCQ